MPSTQDVVYPCWTPNQLGNVLRDVFINNFRNYSSVDPLTISITVWNSRIALQYSFTEPISGIVHNYIFVMMNMLEGTTAPIRYFVGNQNVFGSWTQPFSPGSAEDLSQTKDAIVSWYYEGIKLFLENWTDATAVSYSVDWLEFLTDTMVSGTALFSIESDSENIEISDCVVLWNNLNMSAGEDVTEFQHVQPREQPGTSQTYSAGADSLAKIAAALEDLTTQSVDVSINHGSSIYSVYGRTISGSED